MTHEQFIALLAEVENRHPVLSWRSGNLHLWPMMRSTLYATNLHARVAQHSVGSGSANYARVLLGGLVAWATASRADRAMNQPVTTPADAVFLTYSVGVQSLVASRRCNQLLAPYVELLDRRGRSATVWEMSPYGDYNIPRFTSSAFIQPRLLALRAWSQVMRPRAIELALEGHAAFIAEAARAGLEYPYASRLRLERDVWFVRRLADTFKGWLEAVRPTLGFVADAGPREQAFCLACHELGVTSVEIQHGLQGELHPTYGSWNVVPPEGWSVRPDIYWSWDAVSAAAIQRWALRTGGAHRAVLGGDPWMDLWVRPDSRLAEQARAEIQAHRARDGGRHHILVSLSYLGDVLPEPVAEAMRQAPESWRFWLRLHPVNQPARRRELAARLAGYGLPAADSEFATRMPLPALLAASSAHLSVGSSTVVQQAASLGLRSVACGAEAEAFFAREREAGMARAAITAAETLDGLRWAVDKGRGASDARPDSAAVMGELLAATDRGEAAA